MKKEKLTREVFTAAELAKLFGVSLKTIYLNAKRGNIPTIRLGRRLFFPKRAIFNWFKTAQFPKIDPSTTAQLFPKKPSDHPLPLSF